MITEAAAPGDVLAVWTGSGITQDAIRIAESLRGLPAVANHVIIITHQDPLGRWIGIQGQPGGVGLADASPFLEDPRTQSNHDQARADDKGQLSAFLSGCAKSLGLPYDWVGIAEDALDALKVPDLSRAIDPLWRWPSGHLVPGHVVCSSLAAMLYDLPEVGWPHPDLDAERTCMPADWWNWSRMQAWGTQAAQISVTQGAAGDTIVTPS
jgi:hypothetical protein